ncbi:MAG: low molecular weight protein-tyrosine-phosphatase [Gammaproteobacteria bacterium]|jgi:protein-tyrosine phosphatase
MAIASKKYKVLFVCMGNICRSPAAEGVFRDYIQKAGQQNSIIIESAGTLGYHQGSPPDSRMLQAASRRGYELLSSARKVNLQDINEFDLIVAMDHDNLSELNSLTKDSKEHIRLLGSFINTELDGQMIPPVPDPYYGGNDGFENVLDMIESACPGMLEYCLESSTHIE